MKPDEIEVGKEYVLKNDHEYWCIDLQRMIRICDGQDIIVKINSTFQNQVFFGKLIDSQGEIEFGPDEVLREYDEEEKIKKSNICQFFLNIDVTSKK